MRNAWVAATMLLFAGCAITQPTYLSNGTKVVRITCAMAVDGMSRCFRAAGDLCGPRGFAIYDWSGTPWKEPYPDPASLEDDPALASTGLLVACRS